MHLGFVSLEEILVLNFFLHKSQFRIDDSARNMLLRGGYRWNEGRSNQRAGNDGRDWRSCRWRGPKWGEIHQSGRWRVHSGAASLFNVRHPIFDECRLRRGIGMF